jgi:hypothetical protein
MKRIIIFFLEILILLFHQSNIFAQIVVTQSTIKACDGQEINFSPSISGGSGSYTFSWSGPESFTSKIKSPSIANVTSKIAGNYKLQVNDIVDTTLKTISNVEVKYFELPKKGEIKSSIAGDNIFLAVFNNQPKLAYTWTNPNGTTQIGVSLSVSNAKLSDLGDYKLKISDSTSGCYSTFTQTISNLPKTEQQQIIDGNNDELRYWASIGGNLDFANTNIKVNSIYTDLQFNGKIYLNNTYHIQFPMRIYYNNGTGLQTINNNVQRFVTIDTITYYKEKKYKYWLDTPNLKYKTESQNFGLNLPISLYGKIPNSEWFFTLGANLDFVLTTNRQFGYEYSNSDSTLKFNIVDNISKIPVLNNIPNYSTGVIRIPNVFYGTSNVRPELNIPDREWQFFQFYYGLQLGLAYEAKDIDFFIKYSWGANTTFFQQRQDSNVGYYNHILQTRFIEKKKLGIQIFIDLRLPDILPDKTSSAFPYYYVSLAKLINLDALSKLFASK